MSAALWGALAMLILTAAAGATPQSTESAPAASQVPSPAASPAASPVETSAAASDPGSPDLAANGPSAAGGPAEHGNADASHAAAQFTLQPFRAHNSALWKNISVGSSDLELTREAAADHYVYRWRISADGVFHLLYPHDVVQQSWFRIVDRHVRPERYLGEEGDSKVTFTFDWAQGHARGTSEGKPVDIALKSDTQDLLSIQIEVMLDLKNGALPATFDIVDKDQLKDFLYAEEGRRTLQTALGPLETVVVSSRRAGNDRILRLWFAPKLGYIPVQAERTRGDRLEFAMRIRSLSR